MDVPAGVPQEEGHTGFFTHLLSAVRALIVLARRIQPFLSLMDREVEFCVLIVLHSFVCVFSPYSFWTSSSLDVPAGVTQEEGHTGFLIHLLSAVRALIVLARRIQPFLSLMDREVEFCVLIVLHSFVCVFSPHSFWTSSSLDVPAGVTQEEGHTGFLSHLLSAVRALIFLARRIQPFPSLMDREVEFCVLIVLHSFVCVFSPHSFWTSSSLDVPAGVTQEEGHTGFLIHLLSAVRALIFLARRIQPFPSLMDREVEFCVLIVLHSFVCVFSPHSFWTSSSLDVPAGVTQEEGHTLINFSREEDSAMSFPRRP